LPVEVKTRAKVDRVTTICTSISREVIGRTQNGGDQHGDSLIKTWDDEVDSLIESKERRVPARQSME
jgi:hypothetical protein